ncbi:hypothetical protein EHE19_011665 [Ruminiclostridium herbifermentans]|uniref:Uncharacterized protein n=1 Tax=Ruminiclostridium herbifermentans TaxID=2488810 RepID=A0A4U7J9J0_9FIRM|nr:hypothetical protein [Ruminiclostridium herbifermentans]QNU65582.1 hypothetical protein EHE19_011665 [Ruminiclostridium herbifermentans]
MQFETNYTGSDDVLLECSYLLISILLKQYKENVIDLDCFKSNSINKIQYILNNFHKIQDESHKEKIKKLINECIEINNSNNAKTAQK